MYKRVKANKTTIRRNKSVIGEPIETKIERMMQNNEPIGGEVDLTYTERGEIKPGYDIRTDKQEIALDAVDWKNKSHLMKREERLAAKKAKKSDDKSKEGSNKNDNNNKESQTAGSGGDDATNT